MNETTRRTVLVSAAGVGAAAVLAACGANGDSASGANPPAGAETESADGALGKTGDVPVGGGKVYAKQQVVVVQPTAGDYKAFTAICTHEGCTVSTVSDGTINCPCHGSKFNFTDGSVKVGPARLPLKAKEITVKDGEIFLA
jgi:Rieske Fe-S protein